jgi:3-hydroxy-9,10-secoandrosta-1,3,5(10)-triene-9,17-dione monooxygenase reductase component
MTDEAKQSIGKALGKVPSGVYILTATHGGQSSALLVSWVQQAAFAPPALTIAMAKERPARRLIDAGGVFAISVLAKGDTTLMKKYARGIPEGEDPFAGISTGTTPGGASYLADALAWLECRVLESCDFGGDHDIYVAEVVAGHLLKDEPSFTHTRGNGFHY